MTPKLIRWFSILMLYLAAIPCSGQVVFYDDFEDGNFRNPDWQGDTTRFRVEDGKLKLVAEAGICFLPTSSAGSGDTLVFEILLSSDILEEQQGDVILELGREGFNSSVQIHWDHDAAMPLYVWFLTGDLDFTLRGEMIPEPEAISSVRIRLSVVRVHEDWQDAFTYRLDADYTGGHNFELQEELQFPNSSVYGMGWVKLSAWNSDTGNRYAFDDLQVYGANRVDSSGPILQSYRFIPPNELLLHFDDTLAYNPNVPLENLRFNDPGVVVDTITRYYRKSLRVRTSGEFPLRDSFELQIRNLRDNNDLVTPLQTFKLYYDPALPGRPGNLIVNEFMVDPSPPVGLPEVEYIEVYNPSQYNVDLGTVSITTGLGPRRIPADTLFPGEYVVITRPEFVADFTNLGAHTLGVNLDPLANNGDAIVLSGEELIQRIQYNRSYYNDSDRIGNGYAIEYVGGGADPECPDSWRASLDPSGGTPGRINSAYGMLDLTPPTVRRFSVMNDTLVLTFSESVATNDMDLSLFSLNRGAMVSERIIVNDTTLFLLTDISPDSAYILTILADYGDCQGNFPTTDQEIYFGQDVAPNPMDTVTMDTMGTDSMPEIPTVSTFYLRVEQRTVSPDGDGWEDQLPILYGTDAPGYQANLRIYDAQGRPIRDFGRMELPVGEGTILWDGLADNGVWPGRGAYVLLAEVTSPTGTEEVLKFVVVVAG